MIGKLRTKVTTSDKLAPPAHGSGVPKGGGCGTLPPGVQLILLPLQSLLQLDPPLLDGRPVWTDYWPHFVLTLRSKPGCPIKLERGADRYRRIAPSAKSLNKPRRAWLAGSNRVPRL